MFRRAAALAMLVAVQLSPTQGVADPATGSDVCKQLAIEFLEATFSRESERMKAVLADNAEYHVMGRSPRFQRVWDRESWAEYLDLPDPFVNGYALTVHSVMAEDNRVLVEAEGYGIVAETGAVYNNRYAFVFVIGDEKIVHVREYMDTEHVIAVFPPQVNTP